MTLAAQLSPAFHRITLALAREKGHPDGDPTDRYILVAPLQADGRIDPRLWHEHPAACRVVRDDGDDRMIGLLAHGPGGRWSIQFETSNGVEEEPVFHLEDEHLRAGEYLSIIRDGVAHPFRVVAVTPV